MTYKEYLRKNKKCPFCDAKYRELFSLKNAYITYAKAPYHPYHLLIIPKRHISSFFEINKQEEKDIAKLIKFSAEVLKKLNYKDFTILIREGKKSTKSISHLHYHIIPNTRIGDLDYKGKSREILSDERIKKVSKKIAEIIQKIEL